MPESSPWGSAREAHSPNRHVYPYEDVVLHSADERCVCLPRWRAFWSDAHGSVIWTFVHHAADGRPEPS